MVTVVEEKFDRFANDYYQFLALRYNLKSDCRVKVIHYNNRNWKTMIPPNCDRQQRTTSNSNISASHSTTPAHASCAKTTRNLD
jgi:hypothetical protein